MKKEILFLIILILFISSFSCDKFNKELEPSQISWIAEKGYQTENVVEIRAKGKIPAPEIQMYINGESHWLALDVSQPFLILKETKFNLQNFAPSRIVSKVKGSNEMLMEDGFIKNIRIMGTEYDKVHCSLLKNSTQKIYCKGFIGRNFFQDKILTLDFHKGIMAYSEDETIQPLEESHKIPVYFGKTEYDNYPLIYFTGMLDSIEVVMTLNTCHRFSQVTPALAHQINDSGQDDFITIKEVRIGDFKTGPLKCKVNQNLGYSSPRGEKFLDFSMGLNILRNYLVTFDFADSCFYLEKYQQKKTEPAKTESKQNKDI